MREDLPRSGGLQRVEVQGEQAPEQVGAEALDDASPLLVERASLVAAGRVSRLGRSRRPGCSDHPRVATGKQVGDVLVGRGTAGSRRWCRRSARARGRRRWTARRRGRCPSVRAPASGRRGGTARTPATGRRRGRRGARSVPGSASSRGRTSSAPSSRRTTTLTPAATSSPCARWRMRASPSERSLSTSNTPSLKIGQFW